MSVILGGDDEYCNIHQERDCQTCRLSRRQWFIVWLVVACALVLATI